MEGKNARSCSNCEELKSFDNYYKAKNGKYGLRSQCKDCERKHRRKYYKENRNKVLKRAEENKEKRSEYNKNWYEENKEHKLKMNKEWSESNKDRHKELQKQWRKENKNHVNNYFSELRKDPEYRLLQNLRTRINNFVSGKNRSKTTKQLLDTDWVEFKNYIEFKFTHEMNWDNYGDVWHIDHEIPCSKFDLTDPHQRAVCFHWSNLQPMSVEDNLSKGNKIDIF